MRFDTPDNRTWHLTIHPDDVDLLQDVVDTVRDTGLSGQPHLNPNGTSMVLRDAERMFADGANELPLSNTVSESIARMVAKLVGDTRVDVEPDVRAALQPIHDRTGEFYVLDFSDLE